MMIFVIYAALVWWLAAKWRRTWRSFVVVTLAILFILAIAKGQNWFAMLTGFRFVSVMVNALLYPYVIFLGLMGYYIAIIPRPVGEGAHKPCRHCGYDLVGAEEFENTLCPECGVDWLPIKPQSTELAAISAGEQKLP